MGNFLSFFFLGVLLFIHELGHFLCAGMFGCSLYQICFYPFGGVSKFQMDLNQPLLQEVFILVMGPCFQILCYLLLRQLPMTDDHQILLQNLHYGLLFFNLLPIYPLDGGRLFLLGLERYFSFYRSFKMVFFFSQLFLLFFFFGFLVTKELNFLFFFLLLSYTLWKEKQKFPYYYEKFLLERYLGKYHFKEGKIVSSSQQFQRGKSHLIKKGEKYYTEREILQKKFMKKS